MRHGSGRESGKPPSPGLAACESHLIRSEYLEIPGLHLTRNQVLRLWRLDAVMCDALLQALVRSALTVVSVHLQCEEHDCAWHWSCDASGMFADLNGVFGMSLQGRS